MEIFGNPISRDVIRKAVRRRHRLARRFGFDPEARHPLGIRPEPLLEGMLDLNVVVHRTEETAPVPGPVDSTLVVGTIRMGYGHHRIGLAIASAARALGLRPVWLDLLELEGTTASAIIRHMEGLYSLGSRLSRQFPLFDRFYWEPLTTRTFRNLDYNASDHEMCRLMAPVFGDLDRDLPVVGTHTWVCQAALQAGMRRVVNTIPDNWPLGLHLSEGALHTVQSPSAYLGYRMLKDMGRPGEILRPMPAGALVLTGNYVDHELVEGLVDDTAARMGRLDSGEPLRLLISIGGAGTQAGVALQVLHHLAGKLRDGQVALFLNFGQHVEILEQITAAAVGLSIEPVLHSDWPETVGFARSAGTGSVRGVHLFHHPELFPAVYTTNLLMRASDLLLTKPSELAFYPVPRLFLQRVGGHEAWGAIRAAELAEGTYECVTPSQAVRLLDLLLDEPDHLRRFNESILAHHRAGLYRGAYRVVERAMER